MAETTTNITGADLIAAERARQISEEGWTSEHDDEHGSALADAAECYIHNRNRGQIAVPGDWPWERAWWKPSADPVRNLVKAGALIAAEIDRLQRIAPTRGDAR